MEQTWDLSALYSGLDDPRWLEEYAAAKAAAADVLHHVRGLSAETLTVPACREALDRINDAMGITSKTGTFANMLFYTDSRNAEAANALEILRQADTDLAAALHRLTRLIAQAGLVEQLEAAPDLLAYRPYFQRMRETAAHRMPEEQEAAIRRMQRTGGYSWSRLRGQQEAAMTGEMTLHGKRQTLPAGQIRALLHDPDPAVRRAALHADVQMARKNAAVFAACLSGIKGEAQTLARTQRYDGVLSWMLDMNRMRRDMLDGMHTAVREALPVLQRFLAAKAKVLGLGSALAYCDLSAPVAALQPYTFAQAESLITDAFAAVDERLAAFARHAFSHRWIEAALREGRQGGAICFPLQTEGESRIFVNFDGSLQGVVTLAHELGHAWHNRCIATVPMILRDAPTPICETASAFTETLVYAHLLREAKGERRLACLDAVLSGAVQLVLDVYSRFLFEDEVFRRRAFGALDADTLAEIMLACQKAAYSGTLDPDAAHPYMWVNKVHYYIPDFHYYNFPYTVGLLLARSLYEICRQTPEGFLDRYSALLRDTCACSTEEAAQRAGLCVTQGEFWKRALGGYEAMAAEFCRLVGEEGCG